MDASKTSTLRHFYELRQMGFGLVKVTTDEGLGGRGLLHPRGSTKVFVSLKNVREHAQRLSYFGLLDHVRGRKQGGYKINAQGMEFLSGVLAVPETIWCRGGKVVRESPATVRLEDVVRLVFNEVYWDGYAALQVWE
jgi:hypothetical protein